MYFTSQHLHVPHSTKFLWHKTFMDQQSTTFHGNKNLADVTGSQHSVKKVSSEEKFVCLFLAVRGQTLKTVKFVLLTF